MVKSTRTLLKKLLCVWLTILLLCQIATIGTPQELHVNEAVKDLSETPEAFRNVCTYKSSKNMGTGPSLAGLALARPLLGELINNFELYYVAYKERTSTVNTRQVCVVRPVNTVAWLLTSSSVFSIRMHQGTRPASNIAHDAPRSTNNSVCKIHVSSCRDRMAELPVYQTFQENHINQFLSLSRKNLWAEEGSQHDLSAPVARGLNCGLWFKSWPWLHIKGYGFCHLWLQARKQQKMMAGSGNAAFVSKGFANWKDATISFQRDDCSKRHKEAFEKMVTLPATRDIVTPCPA